MTLVVYDTNVVIALLSSTDALHEAALRVAQEWEERGARVVISAVTWAELRTGALRRGPEAEKALGEFRQAAIDEVSPVDVQVADIAASFRAVELSLRMPDALILATGQRLSADVVLTGDVRMTKVAPHLVSLVKP